MELRMFNKEMKGDGHTEKFRLRVTDKVLEKVDKAEEDDEKGVKKYYRNKGERTKENEIKKKKDKTKWFKDKGYEAMLKVDYTPGSKLAKRINERIKKEIPKTKVMITELTGKTKKSLAMNAKDPWVENTCKRDRCYQCQTTSQENGLQGKCWQSNSTYQIECRLCREKGE